MTISIVLTTILSTFATSTPNLCDEVYLDSSGVPYTDSTGQTLSRYCVWTGPRAPVWDADVCCIIDDDGASCSQPTAEGRCPSGVEMYCEYGAAVAGDGVLCYQPLPSMCDAGLCTTPPPSFLAPSAQMAPYVACCNAGACQFVEVGELFDCQGEILACNYGVSNADGTVDCYG